MTGPESTIEHVVVRAGRSYRVHVPSSVVDQGEEAVELFVGAEVQHQDRAAAQADAGAAPATPAPAELTAPDQE